MVKAVVQQTSFNGGELSEVLYGRTDIERYSSSVKQMTNFIPSLQGSAKNRPGTEFVCETKDSGEVRLIPFQFNVEQSYVLEFGEEYVRFISGGGQVVDSSGNPVEITSPYACEDLERLQYCQSADIMYLVHPKYPPYELKRFSNTNWILTAISFGSSATKPTGLSSDDSGSAYAYKVTSIVGGEESLAGDVTSASRTSTLSWTAVTDADSYNVYLSMNGVYGWIGGAGGASFKDDTIEPDMSKTPPINNSIFSTVPVLDSLSSNIVPILAYVSGDKCSSAGWTAEATNYYDGNHTLDLAFDHTTSGNAYMTNDLTDTITITPSAPTQVSGYSITAPTSYTSSCPLGWTFEGYKDGTWTTLDTVSGQSAWSALEKRSFDFYNQTPYSKYRITPTEHSSGAIFYAFEDIELFTGTYSGGADYPGSVFIYQQRLIFARTDEHPQTIYGSQTGNYYNFNTSSPLQDDDSYEFTIDSNQVNAIQWLSSIRSMIIGSIGAEWEMTAGSNGGAITATSVSVEPQGNRGSEAVIPIVIGSSLLFVSRGGQAIRDYGYSYAIDGYTGENLSIYASHLFEDKKFKEWAFHRDPYATIWIVCDDGSLLGMTYDKDQKVLGWHKHETEGLFESVAVISGSSD